MTGAVYIGTQAARGRPGSHRALAALVVFTAVGCAAPEPSGWQ
jgi:hypothetical protein